MPDYFGPAARVTAGVLAVTYTTAVAVSAIGVRRRQILGQSIDGFTIGGVAALLWLSQNPEFAAEIGADWTNWGALIALSYMIDSVWLDNARLRVAMYNEELETPP